MENVQQNHQGLTVTFRAQQLLKSSANWAKFVAIFSILFTAVIGMGTYIMYLMAQSISRVPDEAKTGLSLFTAISSIILIAVTATYFYSLYRILKFSGTVKFAIESYNSDVLTESFEHLKAHYKSLGIMMIVMLVAYFIIAIAFGIFIAYATKIMMETF
ncbi:hypothetical protein [Dysgonomonas macrotermitis]|uniref:Uncharacterized protein n=1 Tax=Dysgonomonas macrotermitis TaxID=1346286 RepID=A0A1M5G2X3_9BACT|nr:hypothetical protein [Dysgonomonas macrotermitis]SHF98115.1 hypothetical protein SAMN05444362_11336 [Dysgonomonas macrotermitis]